MDDYQERVAKLRAAHLTAVSRVLAKLDEACRLLNADRDFAPPEPGRGGRKPRSLAPQRWRFVIDGHKMLAAAINQLGNAVPDRKGVTEQGEDEPLQNIRLIG